MSQQNASLPSTIRLNIVKNLSQAQCDLYQAELRYNSLFCSIG
nr:MAG TPA: hypothetical protein [Bacteriophage sp.]